MKKALSFFLFCVILLSVVVPVAAADTRVKGEEVPAWAERYAYLDLESASPALKEKILQARRQIIFSTDWVADGYSMWVEDIRTGEIIREIPKFSEVFPGWDIPKEKKMDDGDSRETKQDVVIDVEEKPTAQIFFLSRR